MIRKAYMLDKALRAAILALSLSLAALAQSPSGAVADGFTFAAGGDIISPRPFDLARDSAIARVAALFQQADLGFANQEGAIFDVAGFKGSPAAENGGGTPVSPPQLARDLKSMGISIVSKANNHATDWGGGGLMATLSALAAAGIVQAGSGPGLSEARAPGYVETRRGTAALISVASTFPPMSVAGPPVTNSGITLAARPGISALHVRLVRCIVPENFTALRRIAGGAAYAIPGRDDEVRLGDVLFRKSESAGLTWEMLPADETAVLASVRDARAKSGFVLFAIHAHQTAGDQDDGPAPYQPEVLHFANEAAAPNDPRPADFEPALFHAVIDAGADAVVRTGPHILNGIEIYKGKPIFYSLGSLFFPFGQRRSFTTAAGEKLTFIDENFETVIPVTTYKNGKVSEIRLYPVAISSSGTATGSPFLAPPDQARRILERVRALSTPFGTNVSIENGIGIIRPSF
jgi:poly-gamma-glutamate capsule biosynthesis protein CapA/YwtB (metallophosphatase superfamily)